jgi:hypothetical protein
MTKSEITRELFGRNKSAAEVNRALGLLSQLGLAKMDMDRDGEGRPSELWFATPNDINDKHDITRDWPDDPEGSDAAPGYDIDDRNDRSPTEQGVMSYVVAPSSSAPDEPEPVSANDRNDRTEAVGVTSSTSSHSLVCMFCGGGSGEGHVCPEMITWSFEKADAAGMTDEAIAAHFKVDVAMVHQARALVAADDDEDGHARV